MSAALLDSTPFPPVACTALFAALIASGCGESRPGIGSEAAESTAAVARRPLVHAARTMGAADPPLSKRRFVTRVNAICRGAWPAIRTNLASYQGTQDPKLSEQRRFRQGVTRSMVPEIKRRLFDPIMALGAPQQGGQQVEEIMRRLGEAIEIGQGAHGGYPITAPPVVWDLFDLFNPLSRRYGLDECLVNPAHTGF